MIHRGSISLRKPRKREARKPGRRWKRGFLKVLRKQAMLLQTDCLKGLRRALTALRMP